MNVELRSALLFLIMVARVMWMAEGATNITVWEVGNQEELFNKISSENSTYTDDVGNAIMGLGDTVTVALGNYAVGLAAYSYTIFVLVNLFGILECEVALGCDLDGGGKRRVMTVSYCEGGVVRIMGMRFVNGDFGSFRGGGLYINLSDVELSMCAFNNNNAKNVREFLLLTFAFLVC